MSQEGMREQHAGRAPWELVQNVWDEAPETTRANRSAEQALRIRRPRGDPVPLASPAIVPQNRWEEIQELRACSRERPRRSLSRPTDSQRKPLGPQCPGSWLHSNGASAQSPDPPQGPAKPPVHGRQRCSPFRAGTFGSVHRGLKHGRDRLRRPEQCPASEEPELENRVEALTGPAPRHEFHPRLRFRLLVGYSRTCPTLE